MLTETGLVTRIENNIAWINTRSKLACSSCQVESTCGNGILEKYLADRLFVSQLPNELNAKIGDEVTIAVPKASVTKAALVAYLLPIVAMFLGAIIFSSNTDSELMSILGGGLGFLVGLVILSYYNKQFAQNTDHFPKMIAKRALSVDVSQFDTIKVKNL